MTVSPADGSTDKQVRAARGVFARHRRQRYPDRTRCGFCGGRWRSASTGTGRTVEGCAARHLVAGLLDGAGQLDEAGRLVPPRFALPPAACDVARPDEPDGPVRLT